MEDGIANVVESRIAAARLWASTRQEDITDKELALGGESVGTEA